ncbi:MAG: hypothetical protein ACT4QF_16910 [Sporichthyaceae bacterium]
MTRRLLVPAVALAALIPIAAPVAASEAGARCTFSYLPRLSPGLTTTPSTGKIDSDLNNGVADCTGVLNGANVTGPGKFAFFGTYENGTCQGGGTGKGFIVAEIPTYTGTVKLKDPVTIKFGTGSGFPPGAGDWTGQRTTGRYLVLPTKGDCVSSPVTEVRGQGPWEIAAR